MVCNKLNPHCISSIIVFFCVLLYCPQALFSQPVLISPQNGDILDNNCRNFSDSIVWDFEWSNVPYATLYRLYVKNTSATLPMIDSSMSGTTFHYHDHGWISDDYAEGWTWEVNAWVPPIDTFPAYWTGWSELRNFSVEPLNSDCNWIRFTTTPDLIFETDSSGMLPDSQWIEFCSGVMPLLPFAWWSTVSQEWVNIYPSSGSGARCYPGCYQKNVSVNTTDLDNDTNYASISIYSNDVINSPITINVTYIIRYKPSVPLIDTVLNAGTGGDLIVIWHQADTAYTTHYQLYYGTSPGDYTATGDLIPKDTKNDYRGVIEGLTENTPYYAAIRAYNANADTWSSYAEYGPIMPTIPVFFVHGLNGTPASWLDMQSWFASDGFSYLVAAPIYPCGMPGEAYFLVNASYLSQFIENALQAIELDLGVQIESINIVAYSMGGLVARRYISRNSFGWEKRHVRNLVMVGTPNNGSPLAKWGIAPYFCPGGDAVKEMTPENMLQFNRYFGDNLSTAYYAVWGSGGNSLSCYGGIATWLLPWPHDGAVDASSAIGRYIVSALGVPCCHNGYLQYYPLYSTYIKPIIMGDLDLVGKIVTKDTMTARDPQICYELTDSMPPNSTKIDSFAIEPNNSISVVLGSNDSLISVSLMSPDGYIYDSTLFTPDSSAIYYSDSLGTRAYYINNAAAGMWHWTLQTGNTSAFDIQYSIVAGIDNSIDVSYSQNAEYIYPKDTLVLNVSVKDNDTGIIGLTIQAVPIWSNGIFGDTIELHDDGLHNDAMANDGKYGTYITAQLDTGVVEYKTTIGGSEALGEAHRVLSFYAYWIGIYCGDANCDGKITVGDAIYIISYIFRGGPTPTPLAAANANCDGKITVGDAVYIVSYIFRGGPAPCCP